MRLQRFLSQAGVASRRNAEEMIRAGRVRVNGQVVTEMGVRIEPSRDAVEVDGRRVRQAARVWLALHKPPGYLTSRGDPYGRPTIYELLPARFAGLFHVGRLDLESEGLLLLTNDGETAHRLLHPGHEVERVYRVDVRGTPSRAALSALGDGVPLDDGVARAVRVRTVRDTAGDHAAIELTLAEGRKREVRRMLDAVGYPVTRLVRVRYGPIELGALPAGRWRRLTPDEVGQLASASQS